jgi:hypothetical protein
MNCKECARQIRMALYKHMNHNGQLREQIEVLPEIFDCSKIIHFDEDGYVIEVICEGIVGYLARKQRKIIYEALPEGSPLKNDVRGNNNGKKRRLYIQETKEKRESGRLSGI